MKSRNQLIASAYVLMMIGVLLVSSISVSAGSGSTVSTLAAPLPGPNPEVTAVSANLTNAPYNSTGTVYVKWTVQANKSADFATIWNYTRLTNVSTGWQESGWVNESKNNVRKLTGLIEDQYIFEVFAAYWNASAGASGAWQNSTVKTVAIVVDKTSPTVTIGTPSDGSRTNLTNFTASFSANGTGSPIESFRANLTNVTGAFSYGWVTLTNSATSAPITRFSEWENLSEGSWSLWMQAIDAAGNLKNFWSNFSVGPYVDITNPGAGVNILNFTATWTPSLVSGVALDHYTTFLQNVTNSKNMGSQDVTVPHLWITNLTIGREPLVNTKTYKLFVNVTDANAFTWSNNVTFIVDTIPPSVHWLVPANGTFTNNASLAIQWSADGTGSAIATSTVTIYNDTTSKSLFIQGAVDTTTLDSVWGSPLADGAYKLKVVVHDTGGNSAQNMTNVTVDTLNPTVVIDTPANGTYWNNNNFDAAWTASGTGTAIVKSNVTISNGTTSKYKVITGTGSTSNMSSIWGSALPDGAYEMTVVVYDSALNSAEAKTNFTVDTVKPVVDILAPANGSYNNTGTVTVRWQATDVNLDHIWVKLDSDAWVTVSLNTSQAFGLSDGPHTVYVRAFDKAANNETASVQFTVDTIAPVISDMSPANNSFVRTAATLFSWNVTEVTSGVNRTMVSIDSGTVVNIGLAKTFTTANLPDGWHWFNMTVYDNATNFASMSVHFFVDTQVPIVAIAEPLSGAMLNDALVHFVWFGSDQPLASGIAYYEYSLDGAAWINAGLNTSADLTALEGNHTFNLRAFDKAGNPSNVPSVAFMVDLTAPVVNVISPADGAKLADQNVTVLWSASDPTSNGVASGLDYLEVRIDGGSWTLVGTDMSHLFLSLADGIHVVDVKAYDNAGNSFTASVNFMTDITGPVIEVISPAEGAHFRNTSVLASWNVTDATSGVDLVQIRLDGGEWTNVSAVATHEYTSLSSAVHTFEVRAVDVVGNVATKSVEFTVDMVPPEVVITHPAADQHVNDAVVTATWTAADPLSGIENISVSVDGGAWIYLAANATSYAMSGLDEGSHSFAVKAVDGVGNNATATVAFVVDRTAPLVSGHTPTGNAVGVTSTITVTFDEAMSEVSIALSPSIAGTMTHTGNVYTLTLSAAMAYATSYGVTVTGSDLAGNPLATYSWTYSTICQLTGIVNGPDGNPIANATVTLKDSNGAVVGTAQTDSTGHFAILAAPGVYNATISASGMVDQTKQVTLSLGGANSLGTTGLAGPDYTWVIILVIVVIVVILLVLFMMRRRGTPAKSAAKPAEKPAEKPAKK